MRKTTKKRKTKDFADNDNILEFDRMRCYRGLDSTKSGWETEAAFYCLGANIDIEEFESAYELWLNE